MSVSQVEIANRFIAAAEAKIRELTTAPATRFSREERDRHVARMLETLETFEMQSGRTAFRHAH